MKSVQKKETWVSVFAIILSLLAACGLTDGDTLTSSLLKTEHMVEYPSYRLSAQQAGLEETASAAIVEHDEIYGVWLTQFELNAMRSGNADEFRSNIAQVMENCTAFGINTLFVQMRPNGDALYSSSLFPWSSYASGTAGQDPGYDPLQIIVEEAHGRGLTVHVWVNPYRLQTQAQMETLSDVFQTKQWYNTRDLEDRVVVYENQGNATCYLNPAYAETRQLIFDGIAEIVSNYAIDGIHIDDYFYPTTAEAFDVQAFQTMGNGQELSHWRSENVNATVKGIYDTVKSLNQSVVFSVSPSGNISNNLNQLYADVRKWGSESGYVDLLIPQIYWEYQHATAPYAEVLAQWNELVTVEGVGLVIGLAAYKIGTTDGWSEGDVLSRQVTDARQYERCKGVVFYSYSSLWGEGETTAAAEKGNLQGVLLS